MLHEIAATSGIDAVHHDDRDRVGSAADVKLSVLKTSSKLIFVLLTQFVSLTSATSFGSANVMSTH